MKRFTVIFTSIALLLGLTLSVQSEAKAEGTDCVRIPIIMYHQISSNPGLWSKLCITPEEFEADLKFLKENDYHVVTMSDLIAYVHHGVALPENPIVLTFDDGNYSDYRYVFPLLKEYGARAVISIIGYITDEYTIENRQDINYPNLTWYQISEMMESGLFELQNHGYDLHSGRRGAKKRGGESEDNYFSRLKLDAMKLQNRAIEKTGITPNTFTYPFGEYSPESDSAIAQAGFAASLICEERINLLVMGDKESLYGLGRFLRPHGAKPGAFFDSIDVDYIID